MADLVTLLLQFVAGPAIGAAALWATQAPARRRAGAEALKLAAETQKLAAEATASAASVATTEAETWGRRWELYREQLGWDTATIAALTLDVRELKARADAQDGRIGALELHLDDVYAAIGAEPDGGKRVKGRLTTQRPAPALVIRTQTMTIEGGVAGGSIGATTVTEEKRA